MKGKRKGERKREGRGEKKGEGKKGERKKRQSSTAGVEPATFHSAANCLCLPPGGRIARTYYTCILYRKFRFL